MAEVKPRERLGQIGALWRRMPRIRKLGYCLLGIALLIGIVGYFNQHGCLYLGKCADNFLQDFYANLSAELASIAITVLIIDEVYRQRETESNREDLILQMGSQNNAFAREAARKLQVRKWHKGSWLQGAALSRADLSKVDLSEFNLCQADLRGALLCEAELESVNLHGANLEGANLSKADLHKANLHGADLSEADLQDANFHTADLGGANLCLANLVRAVLVGTKLREADLEEADLRGADLYNADLYQANLRKANLRKARVSPTQLELAKSLEGAIMPDDAKHEGDGSTEQILGKQKQSRTSLPNESLRKARERAKLSRAELAEQVGVSKSAVGKWERYGVVPRSIEVQRRVAEILGRWPWPENGE